MKNLKPALLMDLLPYEIPLIYSNESLYDFLENQVNNWDSISFDEVNIDDTQPYNFYISKNDQSYRLMSLLHPLSQLQILMFLDRYDNEIINFFNTNSLFSIRYPNGINSIKQKAINKIESEMSFILNENFEMNNNDHQKYMDSYFSKFRFVKITDFYKSHIFKKLETKFSILQKLDISNCFYNIYTHSIDWAYLGNKEYAKENRNKKRFSAKLDQIMMSSNYGETNGIVVGPEFSRIVAEMVLTRIDRLVYEKLKRNDKYYKKNYEVVRYIDDIFIFTNDRETAELVKKFYEEFCNEYKLRINESKAFLEQTPFLKKHVWVIKLKKILKEYFSAFEEPQNISKVKLRRASNTFIEEIRALIIEFENEKHSIVSFILSSLEKVWINLITKALTDIKDFEQKSYLLFKLIDLIQYILTFSLNSQSVIKFTKLILLINNKAFELSDDSVPELIFKKSLELIKYHNYKSTEILNLIILLKQFSKEIPENILLDILIRDTNYFTLSAVTYYLNEGNRSFRFKKVRSYINIYLQTAIQKLKDKYILPNTNKQKLKKLLTIDDFYIIHDFYSSTILSNNLKNEIKKIKDRINNENWNNDKDALFKLFVDYVKDFNKPFMRWDATNKDLLKILVEKTVNKDNQGYS